MLGDALGVPHEFKPGHAVPAFLDIVMRMPADYRKTYESVPYGTWSDDASQLIALLDALVQEQGRYCEDAVKANLLAWYRNGKYQAGGLVFDCGAQTKKSLECLEADASINPLSATHCGNGSLMRVLPAAAMPSRFGVSRPDAVRTASAQSALTHPQVAARMCCALYVELCWLIEGGRRDFRVAVGDAAAVLAGRNNWNDAERAMLEQVLRYGKTNFPTNSGNVLNTFWSAIWAVERATSLSGALRNAVGQGNDTDTVACIAGGLAGLAFGLDGLCLEWREMLIIPCELQMAP